MKEYIVSSGEFNILICPSDRKYYIIDDSDTGRGAIGAFLRSERLNLSGLPSGWFAYRNDESWRDYGQKTSRLNVDLTEDELIDRFVQKRFNFGGLVAERDIETGKVKIFKKHKLPLDLV